MANSISTQINEQFGNAEELNYARSERRQVLLCRGERREEKRSLACLLVATAIAMVQNARMPLTVKIKPPTSYELESKSDGLKNTEVSPTHPSIHACVRASSSVLLLAIQ